MSAKTKFVVCEDHFDGRKVMETSFDVIFSDFQLEKDIEYFKTNGVPVLRQDVIPHLNLGESEEGRRAAGVLLNVSMSVVVFVFTVRINYLSLSFVFRGHC